MGLGNLGVGLLVRGRNIPGQAKLASISAKHSIAAFCLGGLPAAAVLPARGFDGLSKAGIAGFRQSRPHGPFRQCPTLLPMESARYFEENRWCWLPHKPV